MDTVRLPRQLVLHRTRMPRYKYPSEMFVPGLTPGLKMIRLFIKVMREAHGFLPLGTLIHKNGF